MSFRIYLREAAAKTDAKQESAFNKDTVYWVVRMQDGAYAAGESKFVQGQGLHVYSYLNGRAAPKLPK